jgi:hypothetical protein
VVLVEIHSPVYDEEAGSARLVWRASVKADADQLEIAGDGHIVAMGELPVLDAATGKQLSGFDDPERWARNLPYAFRAGDLVASVLRDDDPVTDTSSPEDDSPRETPRVPADAPAARVPAGTC